MKQILLKLKRNNVSPTSDDSKPHSHLVEYYSMPVIAAPFTCEPVWPSNKGIIISRPRFDSVSAVLSIQKLFVVCGHCLISDFAPHSYLS